MRINFSLRHRYKIHTESRIAKAFTVTTERIELDDKETIRSIKCNSPHGPKCYEIHITNMTHIVTV